MDDGNYVSFIIWKDYNCNGWNTIDYKSVLMTVRGSVNTFPSATHDLANNFANFFATDQSDDPWAVAVSFITQLQNFDAAFQGNDKAFTVVLSQSYNARYFAKVCASGYVYNPSQTLGQTSSWGKTLLLQMR
jgi:alpha-amylase/alpha-mannosidase (GH57 family)